MRGQRVDTTEMRAISTGGVPYGRERRSSARIAFAPTPLVRDALPTVPPGVNRRDFPSVVTPPRNSPSISLARIFWGLGIFWGIFVAGFGGSSAQDFERSGLTTSGKNFLTVSPPMAMIGIDGSVRIDWAAAEKIAADADYWDKTTLAIARLMLAIRDGSWTAIEAGK